MDALAVAVQAGIPALVWGAPGTGKTSAIIQMSEALGLHIETIIASIREPSDFGGLPVASGGAVTLFPPAWAKRLANGGILFIDEITTAPPAVQAALLRVILDRVVGDVQLPKSVAMVAAANPPEQAAGGWDLSAPLANRFVHLDWEASAASWASGIMSGWDNRRTVRVPMDDASAAVNTWVPMVAAFIRRRPDLLLSVPKDATNAGRAWPSPRTWDMAITCLAACDAAKVSDEVRHQLVTGCVGTGAGMELLNYIAKVDLPDPEAMLADPDKCDIPDAEDAQYAVYASVVGAVIRNMTTERWMAGWTILSRGAAKGAPDIAAACAQDLARANLDGKMPLPATQVRAFIPMLQAAGIMPVPKKGKK